MSVQNWLGDAMILMQTMFMIFRMTLFFSKYDTLSKYFITKSWFGWFIMHKRYWWLSFVNCYTSICISYSFEVLFIQELPRAYTESNRIWWLYRSTLVEVIWTISSANWPLESGIRGTKKCTGNHTYLGLKKKTETCNPKMVFKICEGISCSSIAVNKLDVIRCHNGMVNIRLVTSTLG